jgi:hypothetical protein
MYQAGYDQWEVKQKILYLNYYIRKGILPPRATPLKWFTWKLFSEEKKYFSFETPYISHKTFADNTL